MDKQEVYATLNQAYFSADCHERELLGNLPRLLADARLFVDIGASLGQYTLAASRGMRGGRIIAVEADPLRHEELARIASRTFVAGVHACSEIIGHRSRREGALREGGDDVEIETSARRRTSMPAPHLCWFKAVGQ